MADVTQRYILVPLEPTPAMIDAFVACALQYSVAGPGGWSEYARVQWKQMIDAAPAEAPPTPR